MQSDRSPAPDFRPDPGPDHERSGLSAMLGFRQVQGWKDFMNREAWLRWRRTGIGSTDSAAILGVGRRTPLHVQVEKLDGIVTVEETELMELGRDMEPLLVKRY